MLRAGQGRHVGVSFLVVGPGFSMEQLRRAAEIFAANQPILGGRILCRWPWSVPAWVPDAEARVPVDLHPATTNVDALAHERLAGQWAGKMRFDVVPRADGAVVMMSWSHALFDARGIELALSEIARLAGDPEAIPEKNSWAEPFESTKSSVMEQFREVRPFIDRYSELRKNRVVSLGEAVPDKSAARFEMLRFSDDETGVIRQRAERFTAGIFALPYFLAVTMRAHAAVQCLRGDKEGTLECAVSVQGRKRGARGPIFQNHDTQMFFAMPLDGLSSFSNVVESLQRQFAEMTRAKCDRAFVVMIDWMRRLPPVLYRRFLRKTASGRVASFYHAHTGQFLPGVTEFCGGRILDVWHVPTVPQPPGSGLFFSERNGRLTAAFCWRDGVLSDKERELLLSSVRYDLLGEC